MLSSKYTIFPIQHPDLWEMYLTHKKSFWTVEEVDLSNDIKYWKKLSEQEQHFIKCTLAFFAASDGIVMENLASRFFNDVELAEARAFYAFQINMENEHSIMYSLLIDTYIESEKEKNMLFNAVEHFPEIKSKADWAIKWIQSSESFATRLIAFAIIEGVFFSGSFCCIDWTREKRLGLDGLCVSNDFISRDEGLHCDFAILLYNKYVPKDEKLSDKEVHALVAEAVQIEKTFITQSLPCSLLGMNCDLMKEYIEYVANRIIKQLGHTELYPDAKQPFPFMELRCVSKLASFFEGRVSEYQLANVPKNEDLSFNYENEDF